MKPSPSSLLVLLFWSLLPGFVSAAPPDAFQEHYTRAQKLFKENRFDESVEELKAAYAIRPEPELLLNLGHALRRLGRRAEALRDYRRFQERVTEPVEKAKAQRYIDQIAEEERVDKERQAREAEERTRRSEQQRLQHEKELLAKLQQNKIPPKPLYRRWWFWTLVGSGAALGIAGAVVGATRPWDQAPTDIPRDDLIFLLR